MSDGAKESNGFLLVEVVVGPICHHKVRSSTSLRKVSTFDTVEDFWCRVCQRVRVSLFIFTIVQTAECGLKFERETEGSRSIAGPDTSAESQCRLQTLYLRNLCLIIIHLFPLITPRERERERERDEIQGLLYEVSHFVQEN